MLITKMQCVGNDFLVANCFYDKIENESQHVVPYETDSIQYYFSRYISEKFDLI